jgi:ABC-2 type transport system ATP-binding protein
VVEALLRRTNLWEVRKQRLGGYSGGMRQRFDVPWRSPATRR